MKSNSHLVYITPGFAADEADTSCIPALQDFFIALLEKVPAEKIHIITLHYPFHDKPYRWKGIMVYPCGGRNKKGVWKFRTWHKARKYFKEIHQQHPVGLIHSFWYSECCYLGQRFAKITKVPHVCTILGQEAFQKNRYAKLIDPSALTLIAPTIFSSSLFEGLHPNSKCCVIPLGIDLSAIQKIPREARILDILGVGSLIPLKAFDVFIDTVAQLAVEKKDVSAAIIGEGPERPALHARIKERGLENNLMLLGNQPRQKVLEYMSRSKIFLHPSHHETFGLVYAEALHSGMAIVSRENGCYAPSTHWISADHLNDFAKATMGFLSAFPAGDPPCDFDIAFTIQKHLELYLSLMDY